MNSKIKKQWVEALRSGQYRQGRWALRRNDQFCCLGVLCDIYAKENRIEWEINCDQKGLFGQYQVLPQKVAEWAGFSAFDPETDSGRSLTDFNDTDKLTFDQIADIIEYAF